MITTDHQYLTATLDGLLSEYAQDLEQLHSPEKRLDASRDAEDLEWEEEFRGFPFTCKRKKVDVRSEQNKLLAFWGLRRKHARNSRINGTAN